MSDKLKKFVNEHKQEFDTGAPGKDLWKKIDAQMDVKTTSRISSSWLSKFKYIGFSASVLVIAAYFIIKNLNDTSKNELTVNKKDLVMDTSKHVLDVDQNSSIKTIGENNIAKKINEPSDNKNNSKYKEKINPSNDLEEDKRSTQNTVSNIEKDSVLNTKLIEKKENALPVTIKKTELYIPAEPEKMNTYTATLYDGASICRLLHAYKFPGKIVIERNTKVRRKLGSKETVRTISCSHLENEKNMKAVWLKGKTDKQLTFLLKEGFKDIFLEKKDGRKLSPEAISHYYAGLGVIKNYKGKDMQLIFKDKVELLLFFNDIEAGDRISVEGIIETVVKNKP